MGEDDASSSDHVTSRTWITVCAALLVGCGAGLKPLLIDASSRKPSNVAMYFAVDDADGEPVADLLASDFKIYEDGKLVSADESRQIIANPEVAAVHYTLLLVDMSASVTESDQVGRIVKASSDFMARVEPYQKVAVYAFDGAREIYEILPFASAGAKGAAGLAKLADFRTRDPSTNLHGAIVEALGKLKQGLSQAKVPLRFGTLVVFTDGTDHAARIPLQETLDALDASAYTVFTIGVGNEIDDATLSRLGTAGYIRVESSTALADGFAQIGERIVRFTRRFYLLSYCSPARAGRHKVTVEAVSKDARGEISYAFNARGFGPGCDANKPPPFDTSGRHSTRARKKLALLGQSSKK